MKIRWEIKAIIICLFYIIVYTSFAMLIITNIKPDPKDQYFICCIEKMTSEFYTVVYMKNGETFYPHFTHERQVHAFIEHLEKLGTVDRNGYEVVD